MPADARDFSAHCYVREWPMLIVALDARETELRQQGRTVAANMLLVAYAEFRDRLLELGEYMSRVGTDMLKKQEEDTRVRPDTEGGGGPRLGDFLECDPVPDDLGPGAIGVNNERLLDSNVPWWVTNEVGSTTQIGRKIFGVFYGGGIDPQPPDSMYDRQHPLFAPGADENAGGATLIHGIPARHFVEEGYHKIAEKWLVDVNVLQDIFVRKVNDANRTFR